MDERTREYLRGRFGDYYRRNPPDTPPAADAREWGWIPWTRGERTAMVRHRSLYDLGDLGEFLADERPRHVYFSAGRYDEPGERSMGAKGWRGADLVFDLDADHLPGVDPECDSHAGMLATCKEALVRLVDLLERDFGFDPAVVFSGGRGYHVHVRDPGVRDLDRAARREIADYVLGDVAFEDLVRRVPSGTATKRVVEADGGWARRGHGRLLALLDEVRALEEDAALERLRSFDGVGETRAERVYAAATDHYDALAAGELEVGGPGLRTLGAECFECAVREDRAPIDEPVTTDVNRLIRLPGSLHGGSGLVVRPVERDALADFDPLRDAVPETYHDNEIRIETPEPREFPFGGESLALPAGATTVREPVGMFLMARGEATKAPE